MCVQSLGREDPLRREWQITPVFLPRESHGQRSLDSLCGPPLDQEILILCILGKVSIILWTPNLLQSPSQMVFFTLCKLY